MANVWKAGEKFAIIGGPTVQNLNQGPEQLTSYGSWRVVRKDNHPVPVPKPMRLDPAARPVL